LIFQDTAEIQLPQHECTKNSCLIADVTDDEFWNYESHRILSFMGGCRPWPISIDKFALAASGFYYKGYLDKVHCAFCDLSIYKWEIDDTPKGEHHRWNPSCLFLNGESVGNVSLSAEASKLEGFYDMPEMKCQYHPLSPAHKNMCEFRDRFDTFDDSSDKISTLSDAGFFKNGDQIECFYCAGTIKSVTDPWISHAAWFPTCEYLLKKKSYNFVKSIQSLVIKYQ
jgi:Inhibitor of Apoptosis domain